MSSPQTNEAAIRPASPSTADHEPLDQTSLSPEEVRQIIRLIQCPVCSLLLRDPYTLPCGETVCKACLPTPHQRANISFYQTPDRLQGIRCPLTRCAKEHALFDCSPDVALGRMLEAVEGEFEKALGDTSHGQAATHIIVKDQWQEAGIPSLRDPESTSMLLKGGRLLATYALAKMGDLKYEAEVTYAGSLTDEQRVSDLDVLAKLKGAARVEADCQICYALFYDPVTTPCGHTFCRSCLQRVLDHAKYCPVCRRFLTIQPMVHQDGSPQNQLLARTINCFWADLLVERRQTAITEGLRDGDRDYDIPVFVCTLSFPAMPTFLHVFEPRYRLMIRRALEGDRTFGMVLGGGFMECGTILRIVNVEFFPDGRSLIETVGTSRFRILSSTILDGYVVAKIEKINDISVAEEEELEASETGGHRGFDVSRVLAETTDPDAQASRYPTTREEIERTPTSDLMDFAANFVERMRERSVRWLAARIYAIYGECPNDPALFPWWFANVLPVRESEKYRLLATTSVRERLKICCAWILEWERDTWLVHPPLDPSLPRIRNDRTVNSDVQADT